jgi:hypothetical protein
MYHGGETENYMEETVIIYGSLPFVPFHSLAAQILLLRHQWRYTYKRNNYRTLANHVWGSALYKIVTFIATAKTGAKWGVIFFIRISPSTDIYAQRNCVV